MLSKNKIDVDYYLNLADEGIPYNKIREKLVAKGYEADKISTIMRLVDNQIQAKLAVKQNNNQSWTVAGIGAIMLVLGLGITIYTYALGASQFVITYGLILGGLGTLISGLSKIRK